MASFIVFISLKLIPALLLVTFLLWNCITDYTKTQLHKINFLSDNINSQPFKIHLTAHLLFIHHTEAHQTSNLTGFIMCSLATHPPVNKWHIMHTLPVFHSHCLSPSSELDKFVQWTYCVTLAHQTSYRYGKMTRDSVSFPECQAMQAWRHGRKTPLTKFVVITMVLVKIPVFYNMVPCR